MDIVVNGISVVGILTAIGGLLVLLVPKLREKFTEYILLKYKDKIQTEQIEKLIERVEEQEKKIEQLTAQVNELTIENHDLRMMLMNNEQHLYLDNNEA